MFEFIDMTRNCKKEEEVVEDAKTRIHEALSGKISRTAREYYFANGNKEEKHIELENLTLQFLQMGGTTDQLNDLINEKREENDVLHV